jgi:hypothetical protein
MQYDITGKRDMASDFVLIPHSAAANVFLTNAFADIGDHDLTLQDYDLIVRRAQRHGFRVNDTLRNA